MLVYYKDIFNFVTKLVGDKEAAKDITQEAYAKCIELDSNKEINRSFLYKVAKNIVIDESRKNKKISQIEFQEEIYSIPKDEQPDEIVLETNQYENLMKIVETLPNRSKEAFLLHTIDGYSRKEIAFMMGISPNAVEKHIIRATKNLQEKLTK
ncbi:RNA polymerase subunit sigma [Arcobacter suis]|jgi:RNA polymerase sigma-70 factor (ECF subfamily)|uniref:Sigma factor, ECF family n=1 Tax=Arcobacter suis CECT 7833 TaxID=663365 RepID=A0AAD0STG6_9BACT|nr:sigma-70 family RNA polymerase sigma factor [Arcobacter suis]AXX90829.1 sigma factor, ECF family [Arcobacter suis CECT 7833]RWS47033.1 RNA polymerase subunit sigma [Arcobacter suis]